MVVIIVVLINEGRKYNTVSAQHISLIEEDLYTYDIRDAMPLRYVHWFWLD